MPETVTDVTIDAPAERVWRVLSDFSRYPDWNPLIRRIEGKLELDSTLTVTRAGADGSEKTSHPTVLLYRPGREIRWRDRPILPGLMETEHGFKIEPLSPEQARFVHWESSSGILAPILAGSSETGLRDRLEAMNLTLKGQVERGPVTFVERDSRADVVAASRKHGLHR
jgi:hypothetical protein